MTNDSKYSKKIDCNLNYYDIKELVNLFEEAKLISDESIFRFLEEVFNAPTWKRKTLKLLNNLAFMLNYANRNFDHPIKEDIFIAGISKLNGTFLSTKKVMTFMTKAKKFRGYYAVLNIIISSHKPNSNMGHLVENLYNSIILQWSNENTSSAHSETQARGRV